MSNQDDRWLWFIDDGPLQALLKADVEVGTMKMRASSSPALVRAMTSHLEGRIQDAMDELRAAIAGGERQPEMFLMLGQLLVESGKYEDAAGTYGSLLETDPEHAQAAFNRGVCFEKLSRWNEAGAAFRSAVKGTGALKEAWLGLGLSCLHQRKAEDALQAFQQYLELDKDNESALFGSAVALQMLRRFDEASAIYDRFRSGGEPSAELLTNLLALAVARKDNTALARIAAELSAAKPGSRQTLEAQAYAAMVSGDWEGAAKPLQALAERGNLPEDWALARAYSLWRRGGTTEALEAVQGLLIKRPGNGAALLIKGALLERLGQTAEALAAFRKAVYELPDSDPGLWNLARLGALEGKAEVCAQAAKSLLERNPQSADGHFAAGMAAVLDERPEPAIASFDEAIRLRPNWPEAEYNRGVCFLAKGDASRADQCFERCFDALRGAASAEPVVQAAILSRRLDRAVLVADASADIVSDSIFNLAVALHDTGRLEDAERYYRSIAETEPAFADAQINLGHILLARGNPEAAHAIWDALPA